MTNLLGSIIGPILGGILGFILGHFSSILKGRRATPKLGYERVSSLSLVSMDERIRSRIKVVCDGKPTNNIFSFKFRIRNTGKVKIEKIPILVEFNDKNTQILDIKETFEVEEVERNIELSLDETNRYKGKFIIVPGLDSGETATFDVFTKENKTAELASLIIRLGKEKALGMQWGYLEKEEMTPMWARVTQGVLLGLSAGLIVSTIVRPEALLTEVMSGATPYLGALLGLMVAIGIHFAVKSSKKHD